MVQESEAQICIFDHSLSGVQTRNLEEALKVRVLDRSQLILDIFAQRAQTYEGKLQVELAQMMDQLPRMVRAWKGSLSRLGGGIGTRGPGETALEIDRRRIRERLKVIRQKLAEVQKNREQHRSLRARHQVPSFALIGYTNSGKSTLFNRLTKSEVLTADQLFATLDPTTRKIHLPATSAVVTDTVGFIRKLPHHLIEAFKATLEESASADVLLHVIDLSSPSLSSQIQVVNQLIEELGWGSVPQIHVFNKVDQAGVEAKFKVEHSPRAFISARTGEGIAALTRLMQETVDALQKEVTLFFPRAYENLIFELSRQATITKQEVGSTGTLVSARLPEPLTRQWQEFVVF